MASREPRSAVLPSMHWSRTPAKQRRFDVLVVWRLDRLGRSLRHLILLLDDLQALGVAFVSLGEGIDATTPAGRLQLNVLGAISQFERERIAERVKAGLSRARSNGNRLGRPKTRVPVECLARVSDLSHTDRTLSTIRGPLLVPQPNRKSGLSGVQLTLAS